MFVGFSSLQLYGVCVCVCICTFVSMYMYTCIYSTCKWVPGKSCVFPAVESSKQWMSRYLYHWLVWPHHDVPYCYNIYGAYTCHISKRGCYEFIAWLQVNASTRARPAWYIPYGYALLGVVHAYARGRIYGLNIVHATSKGPLGARI